MPFDVIAKSFAHKNLPGSVVELVGEIPAEAIIPYRARALKQLAEHLELPGFRPGHVPQELVQKKVGDIAILEEAVELCMADFYPALLAAQKVDAVGRPDIRLTKLAPGNPIGISIRTSVYPTVVVPKNWRDFAGKVPLETVPDVFDAEVDEALESMRKTREKEGVLPALDDEFAKSLGTFAGLVDLKVKLRQNMKQEKEQKVKEVRRGKLIDELVEKTEVMVPDVFVESELEKILAQMREDVQKFGLKFEDYLKKVNKTEVQMREEFRGQARKRAKLQLALNKLAVEEKVEADPAAVEVEIQHALEHFPDARPELVRVHVETVLRNEKILKLLEGAEEKK